VYGAWLAVAARRGWRRGLSSSHTTTLSDIENFGIVLEPVQVSSQFLGNITLAASRKADHDNDQLCTNITLSNSAIWRYFGLGQSGDIKSGCSNPARSSGRLLSAKSAGKVTSDKVR
jgi:hypothetical protein